MTQPLALVLYEKLMPGSQLVNRLQDLSYRVQTISDPALLTQCAEQAKPLLVVADLESAQDKVLGAIQGLRQNAATRHVPVIGFSKDDTPERRTSAEKAGITLFVTEAAITNHLPQLLERALELE
jgi:PleD family two-component response regulator